MHRLGKGGAGKSDGGETIRRRGATPARAFGLGRCSRTHAATSCSRPLADISQMNSGTVWTIADGEVHGKPLEVGCAVLQGVPAIPTLLRRSRRPIIYSSTPRRADLNIKSAIRGRTTQWL